MATKSMEESKDPFIELYRTLEEALEIVGTRSKAENGLYLDTAELELKLLSGKKVGGGVELKPVGIDISAHVSSESEHTYKLKLRRTGKPFIAGSPPAMELAETILSLAKSTEAVMARVSGFEVVDALVTVDVTVAKDGSLKIWAGGGGSSGNVHKITMTFTRH